MNFIANYRWKALNAVEYSQKHWRLIYTLLLQIQIVILLEILSKWHIY